MTVGWEAHTAIPRSTKNGDGNYPHLVEQNDLGHLDDHDAQNARGKIDSTYFIQTTATSKTNAATDQAQAAAGY